jgi:hypothetical protein
VSLSSARLQTTSAARRRSSSLTGGIGESSRRGTVMRGALPQHLPGHADELGDFSTTSPSQPVAAMTQGSDGSHETSRTPGMRTIRRTSASRCPWLTWSMTSRYDAGTADLGTAAEQV